MTDETQATPAKRTGQASHLDARVDLHPDNAFSMWMEMDCPSYAIFEAHLRGKGFSVSRSTLRRWAIRYQWIAVKGTPEAINSSSRVMRICETLKRESERAGPEVYSGLQARILTTLGEAIPRVRLDTPDDISRMIEAAERLRSLIHNMRGDKFTGPAESGTGATRDTDKVGKVHGTLTDMLKRAGVPDGTPVVEIGSFRKPNGANGANG
ncbi:hypothetical protein [Aestuariivirga sp.]|uniref:hypothetical protein n=1 Tax=Aestuariivirga sp. TaxID=2650926 RepID=UPI0039E4C273